MWTRRLYRTLALHKVLAGQSDACLNYDSFPVVEDALDTAQITLATTARPTSGCI